jgi:hypothetical protein
MAREGNLTEFEKLRIIHCYELGMEIEVVAKVLGRKSATIRSFYSRYMDKIGLPPKDKKIRSLMPAHMGLKLKELARDAQNVGLRKMALILKQSFPTDSWHPSYVTCGNYLKKNGFNDKKHVLKPFINETNRQKRMGFANKWLRPEGHGLGVVVWSDETIVRSRPFTRRNHSWVHKTQQVPFQEKAHSGGISVMFWGCLSLAGRGPIVAIDGTMDANRYKRILREDLLPEATDAIEKGHRVVVMHDGSKAHRNKKIDQYLEDCEVEFLDWPPYSPDLNPIENIWAWIKYKLYSEYGLLNSKDEIIEAVQAIWDQIDDDMIKRFCQHYEKRLHAVVASNGLQTKY